MKNMLFTHINDAHFWAYVGLYQEEYLIPNEINVNIAIGVYADKRELPMIDYSLLYNIIKTSLEGHNKLLEDVLKKILDAIDAAWQYDELKITIEKLNPPTGGAVKSSMVTWLSQKDA